ncbi:MAG: Rne/Rng family ribonuclease [Clostridiales bacterium]|jgi:ribonuclease G|nr:Rne/Rng family ribonuclease [Clostridiales bacterium]
MKQRLYISQTPERVNVALTEGGALVEYRSENADAARVSGNIYKGRIVDLVPGMEAAFVDVGLSRNAYLSAADAPRADTDFEGGAPPSRPPLPDAREGDFVLVQAVKDEIGGKGARLTRNIALPGRFLILLPAAQGGVSGVSRKIEDEGVREKLATVVSGALGGGYGAIVRTAAAEASKREILREAELLIAEGGAVKEAYARRPTAGPVHSGGGLVYRTLRDLPPGDLDKVVTDDAETARAAVRYFTESGAKKYASRVELYGGAEDMFTAFGLWPELEKVLNKRVDLKNGVWITVEHTEAMTVIDVNSGGFVGDAGMEETAFLANMAAAEEIARQLRLRNVGGMAVVDFITMREEEHKTQLLQYLKNCLKADSMRCAVAGMTSLGLVEITRKRVYGELSAVFTEPCGYCGGGGRLFSKEYLIEKLDAALRKAVAEGPAVVVATISDKLMDAALKSKVLVRRCATDFAGRRVYVVPDERIHPHAFRLRAEHRNIVDLPESARLLG